jgi:hypothetical protein
MLHVVIFRHQNAEQNHNSKATNKSSDNVEKFNYLGLSVANQNVILEEIKVKGKGKVVPVLS